MKKSTKDLLLLAGGVGLYLYSTRSQGLSGCGLSGAGCVGCDRPGMGCERGLSGLGAASNLDIPVESLASNADWNAGRPGTYVFKVRITDVRNSQGYAKMANVGAWNASIQKATPRARVTKVKFGNPLFTNVRDNDGFLDAWMGKEGMQDINLDVTVELKPANSVGPGAGTVGWVPLAVTTAQGIALAVIGAGVLLGGITLALSAASKGVIDKISTTALALGESMGNIVGGAFKTAGKGISEGLLPIVLVAGGALLLLQRSGTKVNTRWFST